MEIKRLEREEYAGRKFTARYQTQGYYDICADEGGFSVKYTPFGKTEERSFDDVFFSEWLEEPTAFGAFEGGELIGYVEGSPERWNNRFLISNICVFENARRGSSVGTELLDAIQEAAASGARMIAQRARHVLTFWTWKNKRIFFRVRMLLRTITFQLFGDKRNYWDCAHTLVCFRCFNL